MIFGEPVSCASKSCVDLIEDQQCPCSGTGGAQLTEPTGWWNSGAAAPLNGFNDDGTHITVETDGSYRIEYVTQPEGRRGMPAMGLSEGQIDDVVAYLQTLGARPDLGVIAATEVE